MAQPPYVTAIVRVGTEDLMAPAQGYLALDAESFALENQPDTVTRGADGSETIGRTVVRLVSGVALQLGTGTPEKVSNDAGEAGDATVAAPFNHVHQYDPATPDGPGAMSGLDKEKLDGIGAGAFAPVAGAGLTLTSHTLAVGANGDGSIVVNADEVQVGVLASDAQHGARGGGTQHADAIAGGAAGFMTGADKTKLDSITSGASVASVSGTAPIVSSGGAAPAISIVAATSSVPGSMSAADKTTLDDATATPTASKLVLYGASAELKGAWFAPASGTAPTSGIVRVPAGQTAITGRTSGAANAKLINWESDSLLLGEATGVVSVVVESTTNFQVACGANVLFRANATQLGFFGVTPVSRPAAYTQTYSTASRTLGAYTADSESSAYTGLDNLQIGNVYAKLADLNALRIAVENLRALTENLTAVVNSTIDDLQALGLLQ